MGRLTNALQGRLNADAKAGKSRRKGGDDLQLDLFLSLKDRADERPGPPPVTLPKPEPGLMSDDPRDIEVVLPPAGEPVDVVAEVRAALSESDGGGGLPSGEAAEAKPVLKTGIYRRPRMRLAPPPKKTRSRWLSGMPLRRAWDGLRDWLADAELSWPVVAGVAALIVLVALLAFWSARPGKPEPGTTVDLREIELFALAESKGEGKSPGEPAKSPAKTATEAAPKPVAADWKVAGAEVTVAGGVYRVKFTEPVFVSANYLSAGGIKGLKALAAKLVTMKAGARVVVVGHTDDVPLSRPTEQYRNNQELAALRAEAAREYLNHYARANRALTYETRAGALSDAPYPNDSSQNRRLNRTVTVEIHPAKP